MAFCIDFSAKEAVFSSELPTEALLARPKPLTKREEGVFSAAFPTNQNDQNEAEMPTIFVGR